MYQRGPAALLRHIGWNPPTGRRARTCEVGAFASSLGPLAASALLIASCGGSSPSVPSRPDGWARRASLTGTAPLDARVIFGTGKVRVCWSYSGRVKDLELEVGRWDLALDIRYAHGVPQEGCSSIPADARERPGPGAVQ